MEETPLVRSRSAGQRAAPGASPTTRMRYPITVRPSRIAPSGTVSTASSAATVTRPPSNSTGSIAAGSNIGDCGKLNPSGSCIGPRTNQPNTWSAT